MVYIRSKLKWGPIIQVFPSIQINLIRPGDGVVLTISELKPEVVNSKRNQLTDILQEQTGLVIEIDQVTITYMNLHFGKKFSNRYL
jgi:hypothetical protein